MSDERCRVGGVGDRVETVKRVLTKNRKVVVVVVDAVYAYRAFTSRRIRRAR